MKPSNPPIRSTLISTRFRTLPEIAVPYAIGGIVILKSCVALNFRIEQIVGKPTPVRGLLLTCSGQWIGNDGFLLNLDGRISFANRVIADNVRILQIHWPNGSQARLWRNQPLSFALWAALSDSAIRFVESTRGGVDIPLQLEFQYKWQELVKGDGGSFAFGPVNWNEGTANCPPIARSRWLQILSEMSWSEIEVFELHAGRFQDFENLPKAIERIRSAENALRNGDWNGVLAHCRAALEAAAKSQARSDDVKTGFELLFAAALPEHANKRSELDKFVKALSGYAQLGRHEDFPALQITKSEAEFVYATTLSLFTLLGQRLSRSETVTGL